MPPLTSKARLLAEPGLQRQSALKGFVEQIAGILEPSPIQQAILQAAGQSQVQHLAGQRPISGAISQAVFDLMGREIKTEAEFERAMQLLTGQARITAAQPRPPKPPAPPKINRNAEINAIGTSLTGTLGGVAAMRSADIQSEELRDWSTLVFAQSGRDPKLALLGRLKSQLDIRRNDPAGMAEIINIFNTGIEEKRKQGQDIDPLVVAVARRLQLRIKKDKEGFFKKLIRLFPAVGGGIPKSAPQPVEKFPGFPSKTPVQ